MSDHLHISMQSSSQRLFRAIPKSKFVTFRWNIFSKKAGLNFRKKGCFEADGDFVIAIILKSIRADQNMTGLSLLVV